MNVFELDKGCADPPMPPFFPSDLHKWGRYKHATGAGIAYYAQGGRCIVCGPRCIILDMPRPNPKDPRAGQGALFEPTETSAVRRRGQVLRGRNSVAMDAALEAAREQEMTPQDEGLATVLRAGMWALDSMEASGHHYGPAKLIPGLTEALREAHMTPDSRVSDGDTDAAIAALLTELSTVDTDDDAALSDRAK